MPLFNAVQPRASFSGLTTRMDVPQPILRREFHHDKGAFYGSSIAVYADGLLVERKHICCRDLSDRCDESWGCVKPHKVAIDPVLGRIQFGADFPPPTQVEVSYCYGFPAELGGGSYDRSASLSSTLETIQFVWTALVGSPTTPTLESAVDQWKRTSRRSCRHDRPSWIRNA